MYLLSDQSLLFKVREGGCTALNAPALCLCLPVSPLPLRSPFWGQLWLTRWILATTMRLVYMGNGTGLQSGAVAAGDRSNFKGFYSWMALI